MNILMEKTAFTRRQFFKGAGILLASAVVTGILSKIGLDALAVSDDYIQKRAAGLYGLDESMAIRRSHENPEIVRLYQEFLSPGQVKPVTEKSEHLLHTRYGRDIPQLIEELKKSGHAA